MDDLRPGLQYGYHHYIATLNNRVSLFAGFLWHNAISIREYTFQNLNGSDTSYELLSSFDLSVFGEYKIQNSQIRLQVSFPILAYVLRPGFTLGPPGESNDIIIFKDGNIVTVNNFFQSIVSISYERNRSRGMSLGLKYQFIYYEIQNPQKTGTVANILGFVLTF